KQPHNADSFAGVAPQGPLVVQGDRLLVPGGRSIPACFDRKTGKLLYYLLGENGKRGGGAEVAAVGEHFFNGGAAFRLDTGKHLGAVPRQLVLTDKLLYGIQYEEVSAFDLSTAKVRKVWTVDRKGKKTTVEKWTMETRGKPAATPPPGAFIKAGDRLYVGSYDEVVAYALPLDGAMNIAWRPKVDGSGLSLVAADHKLFAVTQEGGLFCFCADKQPVQAPAPTPPLPPAHVDRARAFLQASGVQAGYCLVWGDPGFPLLRGIVE